MRNPRTTARREPSMAESVDAMAYSDIDAAWTLG
jgi:hypothetical protein